MKSPRVQSTSVFGDALKVLQQIPDATFDACIADPPYNMSKKKGLAWAFSNHVTMQEKWDQFSPEDYFKFTYQWMSEVCRVVKPNGNIFVFGTYHNIYTQGFILQQLDRKILNSIVWLKPNAQPNITCRMLTESTEQLIWACNNSSKKASKWTFNYQEGKKMNGGKQLRNVWTIPLTAKSERFGEHPTQKPLSLMDRLVTLSTKKGDWILDPFAGVGTTGVAAMRRDRHFFLIEKKKNYIDAQKARFKAEPNGNKVLFSEPTPSKSKAKRAEQAPGEAFVSSFISMTARP